MSKLLEQAHSAREQENWQLLAQCLQQLVLRDAPSSGSPVHGEKVTSNPATAQKSQQEEIVDLSQVLSLALKVLEAGDFQDRWEVAKVFSRLAVCETALQNSAIASLVSILQDSDAELELRWFAGRILAGFPRPTPEIVATFIDLLNTAEEEELREMAASALTNLGFRAIDALTPLLAAESSRLLAVQAIAQIRHPQTIEPLLGVVRDPNSSVRTTAIEALSSFDDPRIPLVLVEALNDQSALVRREAANGLGLFAVRQKAKVQNENLEYDNMSDLPSLEDLANLLRSRLWDFNLEVCQQAAIALGRLGTPQAAAALFEVLQSPPTPVALQIEAVRTLGWMGTSDALAYLHQALVQRRSLASYPEVFQEIVTVLGRLEQLDLKSKAAEILIDLLQFDQPEALHHARVKQAVALALGQLGDRRAIEFLIQLLADPDALVQLHAIAALKQLAPQDALEQLQQLAAKDQLTPALKQGVAIAIAEWEVGSLAPHGF